MVLVVLLVLVIGVEDVVVKMDVLEIGTEDVVEGLEDDIDGMAGEVVMVLFVIEVFSI